MIYRLVSYVRRVLMRPERYAKFIGVQLGDAACLNKKVNFGSEPYLVEIGDKFYCSSNVQFVTHDGGLHVLRNLFDDMRQEDCFGKIVIGNNVFLGYGVVVMPGAKVGDNVIVGAMSLVKGVLESDSVYAGLPARRICSVYEYREKMLGKTVSTKGLSFMDKRAYLKSHMERCS